MPAIIAPGHYDLWLNPGVTDEAVIIGYLDSLPSSDLVTCPVNPWVNSRRHDDERCIEPAANDRQGSLAMTWP